MKIVAPPERGMTCDECGHRRPYVIEFSERDEMTWICAYCIEAAWNRIEAHEEALLSREQEAMR